MINVSFKCVLVSFALTAAGALHADSEAMPVYELQPLVVVAPNVGLPNLGLERDTILSAKPMDLAAILSSKLPVAALTRKGPLAGDIVLRGFSRDNVLITVDDNKTFCACPNRMDPPAFHVSSQQIEAIRVRTGPFSVDHGGSVGGTIAVRTTPPADEAFLRGHGYIGSFDYQAAGVTGGVPFTDSLTGLGGLYHQRGGVYKDGSGVGFTELAGTNYLPQFTDRTAFEVLNAEAKGTYAIGEAAALTVSYAVQDAKDVLYPGLRMDAPTDIMNRGSVAFRQPLELAAADDFEASLAFSHVDHDMRDSFRTSLNNMGGAFVSRGYFMRTEARSAFVGGQIDFGKELSSDAFLRYGANLHRRYWDADNVIGNQLNDMLADTVNDCAGIWVVYEQRKGPWAFESGLRLDLGRSEARGDISFLQGVRGTTTNERYDFLPSLYGLVSRDLNESMNAYLGLGFASRMPDPQERYINLNRPMANPDWVGNPDLEPVRNLELQAGLGWVEDEFDADVSVFHAWLFDAIYLAQFDVAPGRATSYENIDARLFGLSADAGWNPVKYVRLEAGLAWQRGEKLNRAPNATNDVLGEIPPLRGRFAALLNLERLSAKAELRLQDDLDRIDSDLGERPIDGWAVLDLAASYQVTKQFSLSCGVDNVFDKTYAVSNSFVRDPFRSGVVVNEPGRFFFLRAGVEL